MGLLFRNFLFRCHQRGWRPSVLLLAGVVVLAACAVVSGAEGVVFSLALAVAFLLGTASRDGPFHLRALAETPTGHPVGRFALLAHMAAHPTTATARPMCLALEIDDADRLRATHGTATTDRLCAAFAQRLIAQTRGSDRVADLGDGRFAVFMPPSRRLTLESAVQTALRLHGLSGRPLDVDGLRLHLTCCVGFVPPARLTPDIPPQDILDLAERALATARQTGPRTVRAFEDGMPVTAPPRSRTAPHTDPDMARAFDNDEIVPWFQPQISAETGDLTGLEALARWEPKGMPTRPPATFLDAIRAQGLSARLTDTMLDRSLRQLAAWDRTGIAIPRVSVNLGPDDLCDPTLVPRVRATLDRYGLSPRRLGIEVLETVVARAGPDDMAAQTLRALGAMGCLIDLDDFGTGSASISGIRRFAVDRIKIDRTLVTAVDTDPGQHAMIAAIVTMAAPLGVTVLAEGVETPGEHAMLAQLGCDHVQGFAIARPMPAADVLSWHLRRQKGTATDRNATPKDSKSLLSLRPPA